MKKTNHPSLEQISRVTSVMSTYLPIEKAKENVTGNRRTLKQKMLEFVLSNVGHSLEAILRNALFLLCTKYFPIAKTDAHREPIGN